MKKTDDSKLDKVTGGKLEYNLNHDTPTADYNEGECQKSFNMTSCGGCPYCSIANTNFSNNIKQYTCSKNYYNTILIDINTGNKVN